MKLPDIKVHKCRKSENMTHLEPNVSRLALILGISHSVVTNSVIACADRSSTTLARSVELTFTVGRLGLRNGSYGGDEAK